MKRSHLKQLKESLSDHPHMGSYISYEEWSETEPYCWAREVSHNNAETT